eukprot:2016122-Pleurochrysis_carterae.AAC.1
MPSQPAKSQSHSLRSGDWPSFCTALAGHSAASAVEAAGRRSVVCDARRITRFVREKVACGGKSQKVEARACLAWQQASVGRSMLLGGGARFFVHGRETCSCSGKEHAYA